jgi:competence protein ComEC
MDATGSPRRWSGVAARWPAIPAALALMCGIICHDKVPARPLVWLSLIFILAVIAVWQFRRAVLSSMCLAGTIFLIGLTSAQLGAYFFPGNHIALDTAQVQRLAELEMRVLDPPHLAGGEAENRRLPLKQVFPAEVIGIQSESNWQPATGRINVTIEPPDDALAAGQTIRALGFLARPQPPSNPGEFDFAAYDRRQRILADFKVRRSGTIQIVREAGIEPLVYLRQSARRLLADGFPVSRMIDAEFLHMLLLGDSDPRLNYVREEYEMTGTAYQLSISGLHIAILGGTVLLLMRLMRMRPPVAVGTAMFVVILYAAVALPSEAGVRALVMCLAGSIGLLARKSVRGYQLLAIAAFGILLVRPMDLYGPGFQIGVAAVLGLLLFRSRVGIFFAQLWTSDEPWQPQTNYGVFQSIARAVLRIVWGTVLVSSVIWIMVMPLIATYFHQANPWSVPGGFVLLPLTIVTLLTAALKVVLTLICPSLAGFWAAAACVPAGWLRHLVRYLSTLPAAGLPAAAPPPWIIASYYALLLTPLLPWRRLAFRWAARCGPAFACALILLSPPPAQAGVFNSSDVNGLQLTLLSIGAGQTALVRVAGGQTFFIDCGSMIPDVYQRVIRPFLQHEGVRRIDRIFLSHGDYDHISAAAEIIEDYRAPSVCLTSYFRPLAQGSFPAQELLDLLDIRGPPPTLLEAGNSLNVGGGANIQVLWPPPNCTMNSNNCGMVLRLTYAGKSILFPADIEVPPELALLRHPSLLKSDVLIAPHEGSAETSTYSFLRAVDPQVIICSSDESLTQKQLEFDDLAKAWPVYRTGCCGAIGVDVSAKGKMKIETFAGVGPVGSANHLAVAGVR